MTNARPTPMIELTEGKIGIYVIYSLAKDGRRLPLYVGQSINPQERLRSHLGVSCHNDTLDFAIQLCVMCGHGIGFEVLEWCDPKEADARERHWIAVKAATRPLCNVTHQPPRLEFVN